MDFFEVLNTRRSIRAWSPEPVSEEDIATLVKAGFAAPSAVNGQPWDFLVVTDTDRIAAIAERHPYAHYAAKAPLMLIVCGNLLGPAPEFWQQDCAAATENILLAARALNLGAVWCGLHPASDRMQIIRDVCGVPNGFLPFSLVAAGHTYKKFTEVDRMKPEKIHRNVW